MPNRTGHGHRVCLRCAPQMVGMVPEMVWVGGFSNLHTGSHPRTLRQRPLGTFPGHLIVGKSLFERLSCTGHPENHKTVYFPTYDKKRRCREQRKPSHSPGDHMGPHTNNRLCLYQRVFLFPRTAIYLPSAPQGIVSMLLWAEFIIPTSLQRPCS